MIGTLDGHALRPLLAPRSVALVGATEREGALGGLLYRNLAAGKLRGRLYAVNPKHGSLFGRPAYARLTRLPEAPDLALIATPAHTVPAVLRDAAEAGIKAAAVVTSDFADAAEGAAALQAARGSGLRLLGPNTIGVMRADCGLNGTAARTPAAAGPLALVSQSGAMCAALLDWAARERVGFSSALSLGRALDVDFAEVLDFLAADAATRAIVLYVEAVRDARRFLSALRAAARVKPVVALKAGGGGRGHALFAAALRRCGAVPVGSCAQLFAAARALAAERFAEGDRLALLTHGSGPGVVAADAAARCGIPLAASLDVAAVAPAAHFGAAAAELLADPAAHALLAIHSPVGVSDPEAAALALAGAARASTKPVLAAWPGENDRGASRERLDAAGIPSFDTPESAVEAFACLREYRRSQAQLLQVPAAQADAAAAIPDLAAALDARARALAAGRSRLTAAEAGALFRAFSIPRSAAVTVTTDGAFGPVIALGAELALPPLNQALALELAARAGVPGGEGLERLSALVCALPWVREADVQRERVVIDAAQPARAAAHYPHLAIHPYPAELEGEVCLRDGRVLALRPMRPEDAARELHFFEGLSERSRYQRFMQALPHLPPRMLARFTQLDYERELALVALWEDEFVGVGRYAPNADGRSAEFALTVADAWQGKGLGRALLERLCECARQAGYRRLDGHILPANAAMLALAARLGFVERARDGWEVTVVRDLQPG